jgi:hypothetical protein
VYAKVSRSGSVRNDHGRQDPIGERDRDRDGRGAPDHRPTDHGESSRTVARARKGTERAVEVAVDGEMYRVACPVIQSSLHSTRGISLYSSVNSIKCSDGDGLWELTRPGNGVVDDRGADVQVAPRTASSHGGGRTAASVCVTALRHSIKY